MIFVNTLWIYYKFREFTNNPLSVSKNYCKFTFCHAKSLWIHYHISEFTFVSLSVTQIPYWSIIIPANSIWFNYLFRGFIMIYFFFLRYIDPSQFSWIQSWFLICSAKSLWVRYQLRKFTMSSLSVTRFHQRFIVVFVINMDPSPFSWILTWLIICLANSLSVFTISYANLQLIHYLFHELTMNSLFFSRIDCLFTFILAIYYGSIISSANSEWILSVTQIHHKSIVFLAISIWILYIFCEFRIDSLFVPRIHYAFAISYENSL